MQKPQTRIAKVATCALVWFVATGNVGCRDPAGQSGAGATSVFVKIVVTDTAGNPVPFAHTTLWTDPVPAIGPLATRPYQQFSDRMILRLESDGTVVQELGVYPAGRIAQLYGVVHVPGCERNWGDGSIEVTDYIVDDSQAHDTIHVSARVLALRPVATIDSGKVCAYGTHPTWGPWSFFFLMSIDSTTDQHLSGRWRWGPNWTDVGEWGTFSGAHRPGFAVLDFVPKSTWRRCTGLRITVALLPDGRWGETFVSGVAGVAGGCLLNAELFTFGSGEFWPDAFP